MFLGVLPTCVTSDPEIIQEILVKRFSNFTNRPVYIVDEIMKSDITIAEDEYWKFLRTILSPSFTAFQLRAMNKMIQSCSDSLVKNVAKYADNNEDVEIKSIFSAYTLDVIAATGFGVLVDSQNNPDDPLVKNAKGVFEISLTNPIFFLIFLLPSSAKLIAKTPLVYSVIGNQVFFRRFCQKMIAERKKKGISEDMNRNLLNLMIKAQLKGHETLSAEAEKELQLENMTDWRTKRGITDTEILAQCVTLLLAAYETTATTLMFFTYLMAIHPDKQEKVYEEILDELGDEIPNYDNVQKLSYLETCMNETLRMYPIATSVDRLCRKTCTIKNVKIEEGMAVRIAVDALHYDPKYWPEPEKFIPERFSEEGKAQQEPFTFIPFGGGPRVCLGMRLFKLEFRIAVVQMMRKFKILATEKTENPLMLANTFLTTPKNPILVKIQRRQ
ncbi:cytochrome P450 3A8-like [Argonauta hians]